MIGICRPVLPALFTTRLSIITVDILVYPLHTSNISALRTCSSVGLARLSNRNPHIQIRFLDRHIMASPRMYSLQPSDDARLTPSRADQDHGHRPPQDQAPCPLSRDERGGRPTSCCGCHQRRRPGCYWRGEHELGSTVISHLTDTPRSGTHQTCYGSRLQNSRTTSMTRALLSVLTSCKFHPRPTNADSLHLTSCA